MEYNKRIVLELEHDYQWVEYDEYNRTRETKCYILQRNIKEKNNDNYTFKNCIVANIHTKSSTLEILYEVNTAVSEETTLKRILEISHPFLVARVKPDKKYHEAIVSLINTLNVEKHIFPLDVLGFSTIHDIWALYFFFDDLSENTFNKYFYENPCLLYRADSIIRNYNNKINDVLVNIFFNHNNEENAKFCLNRILEDVAHSNSLSMLNHYIKNGFFHSSDGCLIDGANQFIQTCAILGRVEMFEILIKNNVKLESDSCVPLRYAYLYGHLDLMEYLLNNGLRNIGTSNNDSLLHLAIKVDDIDTVTFLINENMDVNEQNKYGETPLHVAANKIHVELIKILVDAGADTNALDVRNNSPLHSILLSTWKSLDDEKTSAILLLKKYGARFDIKNNNNKTPLDIMIDKNLEEDLVLYFYGRLKNTYNNF